MNESGPLAPSRPQPALSFGAVILAAGSSSRLGQPKQLLLHQGRPLVVRTAEAALAAGASAVVVVLGAHADSIRPTLAGLPVILADNSAWAAGMGSSISAGVNALENAHTSPVSAVLLAVCDQPHFSASAIARLLTAVTPPKTIAATRHGDAGGVPAIFTRQHFPALRALAGTDGARSLIRTHLATTAVVDMPELSADIDTPADLSRLAPP